jgi:hypothetical protein
MSFSVVASCDAPVSEECAVEIACTSHAPAEVRLKIARVEAAQGSCGLATTPHNVVVGYGAKGPDYRIDLDPGETRKYIVTLPALDHARGFSYRIALYNIASNELQTVSGTHAAEEDQAVLPKVIPAEICRAAMEGDVGAVNKYVLSHPEHIDRHGGYVPMAQYIDGIGKLEDGFIYIYI